MTLPLSLRVCLGQIHVRVGVDDATLEQNCEQIRRAQNFGAENNCDIVVAPELSICGYSPEDLLLRSDVQANIMKRAYGLVDEIVNGNDTEPVVVFGTATVVEPRTDKDGNETYPQGLQYRNSPSSGSAMLANAVIAANPRSRKWYEIYKTHLPNWGVFDEARWFASAGHVAKPFFINDVPVGIVNCWDIWKESSTEQLVQAGARLIVVSNASPFANNRHSERKNVITYFAKKYRIPIAYVNMVEGCDEVVCDGGSFIADANGNIILEAKRFEEDFLYADVDISQEPFDNDEDDTELIDQTASLQYDDFIVDEAYRAIVLGTREFINAQGLDRHVVIGLSGGVDSALVATIAVDALGASRVHGVMLPSKFTSERSRDDATELSRCLGIDVREFSIEELHRSASQVFDLDQYESVVSENIQARLRGMVLMMVSNADGYLVLATSNKSESAVGYTTLYGDSVGAYAPIKDIYKTQVYQVCSWRNSTQDYSVSEPIPVSIIDRAPTAELRENQTDETSLYPYETLDAILQRFVDRDESIESIIDEGFEKRTVERIADLVKRSEFKRKQSPIGPRLTRRNFGKSRRIPISARW